MPALATAACYGIFSEPFFPEYGQDVSVGHDGDVMVLMVRRRGKCIGPQHIALPIEAFNDAADTTAEKFTGLVSARADQITVVREVRHQAGAPVRFPLVNLPSALVNDVRGFSAVGAEEHIILIGIG